MRTRQLNCIFIILTFLFITSVLIFLSIDQFYSSGASSRVQSLKNTFLLILITSAGQNLEKRNAIRNTWLSLSSVDSKHVFVIGGEDKNYNEDELRKEVHLYGDILILPNTSDSYHSLTAKILQAFVHLNEVWKFKFLLKCDDDSFVRVKDIVSELKFRFQEVDNLYWGFFHGSANVKRKGKWKETKWILCDHYLPYALGGGYILSQSLVKFIASNHHYLVIFQPEDVSVGTWLAPINVTRIHDPRFDTEYISRGCSNSYLITHKHDLTNMKYFYSTLKNSGNLCDTEYKLRLSYLYNWDVEPSKCCIRSNSSIP